MAGCRLAGLTARRVYEHLLALQDITAVHARQIAARNLLSCAIQLGPDRVEQELLPCIADLLACPAASLPLLPITFPDVNEGAENGSPSTTTESPATEETLFNPLGPRPSILSLSGTSNQVKLALTRNLEAASQAGDVNVELAKQLGYFVPDAVPAKSPMPVIATLLLLAASPDVRVSNEAINSLREVLADVELSTCIDNKIVSSFLTWGMTSNPYRKASMGHILPIVLNKLVSGKHTPTELSTVDAFGHEIVRQYLELLSGRSVPVIRRSACASLPIIVRLLSIHPLRLPPGPLTDYGLASRMNCGDVPDKSETRQAVCPLVFDELLRYTKELCEDEQPAFRIFGLLAAVVLGLSTHQSLIYNFMTESEKRSLPSLQAIFTKNKRDSRDENNNDSEINCDHQYCKNHQSDYKNEFDTNPNSDGNDKNLSWQRLFDNRRPPCPFCAFQWPTISDSRKIYSFGTSSILLMLSNIFQSDISVTFIPRTSQQHNRIAYTEFVSFFLWPILERLFETALEHCTVRVALVEILPVLFDAVLPFLPPKVVIRTITEYWFSGLLDDNHPDVRASAILRLPLTCACLIRSPLPMRNPELSTFIVDGSDLKFMNSWLASKISETFQILSADPDAKQRQISAQILASCFFLLRHEDFASQFVSIFLSFAQDTNMMTRVSLLGSLRMFCLDVLSDEESRSDCPNEFDMRLDCNRLRQFQSVSQNYTSDEFLVPGVLTPAAYAHARLLTFLLKDHILTSLASALVPQADPSNQDRGVSTEYSDVLTFEEGSQMLSNSGADKLPLPSPDWRVASVGAHLVPILVCLLSRSRESLGAVKNNKADFPHVKTVSDLMDASTIWELFVSLLFCARQATRKCAVKCLADTIRVAGFPCTSGVMPKLIAMASRKGQVSKSKIAVLSFITELSKEISLSIAQTNRSENALPMTLIIEMEKLVLSNLQDKVAVVRCSAIEACKVFLHRNEQIRKEVEMSISDKDRDVRYLAQLTMGAHK